MNSHGKLAAHVLKHDQQAMESLVSLIYDILKNGPNLSRAEMGA